MDFTPSDAELRSARTETAEADTEIATERAMLPTRLVDLHAPDFSVEERLALCHRQMARVRTDYNEAKTCRDDADRMCERVNYEISQGHPWHQIPAESQRESEHWLNEVVCWQQCMDRLVEVRDYLRETCIQDVAYVIHYESVLAEHIQKQLAAAVARAETVLPARLKEADRTRIAAALKRKIALVVCKQKAVSARRLLRGLPLIMAGV